MNVWHDLGDVERIKESAQLMGAQDIADQCEAAREHYRRNGYVRDLDQLKARHKAALKDFMRAPKFGEAIV